MESTNQQFTPDQRARALDLYRLHHEHRYGRASYVEKTKDLPDIDVRAWLAAEEFILDTFTTPNAKADSRIQAWMTVAEHPFFADCYQRTEGTLLDAMIAKLNDVHAHTCEQWRPTTAREIQPGWMIRTHDADGEEASWGVAHHHDCDGDWLTESGALLTCTAGRWTYETTTPVPEPKPDPRLQVVVGWAREPATSTDEQAAIELLTRLDNLKEAEQP